LYTNDFGLADSEGHRVSRYAKPRDIDEALDLLARDRWRIVAGGTDFYPALGARPIKENILDINGLDALRGIAETDAHLVFGARATWSQIAGHPLPEAFDALKAAAREVGSIQIQNCGTIAGNLCNASPAADGVAPLLVLDALVELRSAGGSRHVPLRDFILGNRSTARQPSELVTAILVPRSATAGRSAFSKLGARRYLVISIAMAAARLVIEGGIVSQAAVSVGACSAVAVRLNGVEAALIGRNADASLLDVVLSAPMPELSPIDDVRGSAAYRVEAAREIAARAVLAAAGLTELSRAA